MHEKKLNKSQCPIHNDTESLDTGETLCYEQLTNSQVYRLHATTVN